jgi:hypothetical protein
MGFMLAGVAIHGDTIKLKDGTVLEGDVTAEDDATISIHLELAGGTIAQTRQIDKADIAEITRWTPEQRAAWQVKRDYERLEKYQLNPDTSYEPYYYYQVVNDGFRKFLAQHPDSPYTSNVTARITQWEAERALVAGGKVKLHGRWLSAAAGARLVEREHAQRLLQQGRSMIAQRRFDSAVQQLLPILSMPAQTNLVLQARPLLASAYPQALTSLGRLRLQLESNVSYAQQRVAVAQQSVNEAETSLKQAIADNALTVAQARAAVVWAHGDLNSAQDYLDQVQSQLAVVTRKLAELKSERIPEKLAASALNSQASQNHPAPAPPPVASDSSDVLVTILTWTKNNWPLMAVIGVGLLFLMSQLTKR